MGARTFGFLVLLLDSYGMILSYFIDYYSYDGKKGEIRNEYIITTMR